jgi:hypothetical protein
LAIACLAVGLNLWSSVKIWIVELGLLGGESSSTGMSKYHLCFHSHLILCQNIDHQPEVLAHELISSLFLCFVKKMIKFWQAYSSISNKGGI